MLSFKAEVAETLSSRRWYIRCMCEPRSDDGPEFLTPGQDSYDAITFGNRWRVPPLDRRKHPQLSELPLKEQLRRLGSHARDQACGPDLSALLTITRTTSLLLAPGQVAVHFDLKEPLTQQIERARTQLDDLRAKFKDAGGTLKLRRVHKQFLPFHLRLLDAALCGATAKEIADFAAETGLPYGALEEKMVYCLIFQVHSRDLNGSRCDLRLRGTAVTMIGVGVWSCGSIVRFTRNHSSIARPRPAFCMKANGSNSRVTGSSLKPISETSDGKEK